MADDVRSGNPWKFIPLLYFTQAIPVFVIQNLTTYAFQDLGLNLSEVAIFTGLLGIPWSLQMIFGPFLENTKTRRWWIATMQLGVALGLCAAAFALNAPRPMEMTLIIFAVTGIMSALCNLATDGFAVLSMSEEQRGEYAGLMSTMFRLGRIFVMAGFVWAAGAMLNLPGIPLELSSGSLEFKRGAETVSASSMELYMDRGLLKANLGGEKGTDWVVQPEVKPAMGYVTWWTQGNSIYASKQKVQNPIGMSTDAMPADATKIIDLPSAPRSEQSASAPLDPKMSWTLVWLGGGLLFLALILINRTRMPYPERDKDMGWDKREVNGNLSRTGALLTLGIGVWFWVNAAGRLVGNVLATTWPESRFKPFQLPEKNLIFGQDLGLGPVGTELAQLAFCTALLAAGYAWAKRTFPNSEVGRSLSSFVKQPGIVANLFFVLFYRFPEVMVDRVSPLFLKASLPDGGLAISNIVLSRITFVTIPGLIVGGLIGAAFVQKLGLRKSFIPLALAMHIPNLMYLLAAQGAFPMMDWQGTPLSVLLLIFLDQVGYGFGYTGFMVYLIYMSQKGSHPTSHYAIGTGMGALTGVLAGILVGMVLGTPPNFSGAFTAVLVMAVPAMLTLLFVPLDDSHKRVKVELE